MLPLIRNLLVVFAVCVIVMSVVSVVAWIVDLMERNAEEIMSQINPSSVHELPSWYSIYRDGLLPSVEVGLVIGLIAMMIGIFIYSRRR